MDLLKQEVSFGGNISSVYFYIDTFIPFFAYTWRKASFLYFIFALSESYLFFIARFPLFSSFNNPILHFLVAAKEFWIEYDLFV